MGKILNTKLFSFNLFISKKVDSKIFFSDSTITHSLTLSGLLQNAFKRFFGIGSH